MKYEDIKQYNGKSIFLVIKNGFSYHGNVNKINDSILNITDKYGVDVIINIDDISIVREAIIK